MMRFYEHESSKLNLSAKGIILLYLEENIYNISLGS